MHLDERRVGGIPIVREIQSPLLHPATPVVGPDFVGDVEHGARGVPNRHRRGLVGHPVVRARDREAIRREATVHKRVLLVLDDHETAGAGVVQQPSVARDQRGLGLVRPAADHDRVVPGKIATRERVGTEQLDRHAHRLQRLGHAIGRAPHVADVCQRRQRDTRRAELGRRGVDDRARPDMRVVDECERPVAPVAARAERGGLELVFAGPDRRRGRERDGQALRFVFSLERQAVRPERGPPRGRRQRDPGHGRPARAVGHRDREVPEAAGRPVDRPDHEVRGHRDVERSSHEQRAPHLAGALIPIAVHHLAGQRQRLARDREPHGHLHGWGLEWQSPPRGRHAAPVVQGAD